MGASDGDLLFVYGTLMKRCDHPVGALMRARARFVAEGAIRARLYHISDPDDAANAYPGAVPSAFDTDLVHGEIYEIDGAAEVYEALDHFEACSPDWPEPHEFLRRRMTVQVKGGGTLMAWCYLYTWDVTDAERIPNGRYSSMAAALVK